MVSKNQFSSSSLRRRPSRQFPGLIKIIVAGGVAVEAGADGARARARLRPLWYQHRRSQNQFRHPCLTASRRQPPFLRRDQRRQRLLNRDRVKSNPREATKWRQRVRRRLFVSVLAIPRFPRA